MIPHTARRGTGPLLVCHPGGPGLPSGELHDLGGLDHTQTLVLVDPRGTPPTGTASSYALDDYVADLEELREALRQETIDLLGFSHGALVAAYAIAHSRRVLKLVLANGLAAFTEEMEAEAEQRLAAASGEPWYATAAAAVARERAGEYESAEDTARMWNEMIPLYFVRWDERYRPLLEVERFEPGPLREFEATPFDLRPELGRIAAQTLVLTGRGDFICGPAAAGPLAAGIPGAELVVLEDAGHFTYLEQPERFRAIVEAFLAR